MRDQRQAFEASLVLIEGKAFSTQLIQDRLHAVISHQPQSARSCACTPGRDDRERFCTSRHRRRMARRIPSRADGFPETRCNDHVDSTAQMLHRLKRTGRERQDYGKCITSIKPNRPLLPGRAARTIIGHSEEAGILRSLSSCAATCAARRACRSRPSVRRWQARLSCHQMQAVAA